MSIFSKVKIRKPRKSAFNLSHERKFSCNMGYLIPTFLEEVVPGDDFRIRLESLVRFQALKSPMMHRVDVTTHFFFVPYRLLWNEFEDFITGGPDGTAMPVFPTISRSSGFNSEMFGIGSLADYLGIPVKNLRNKTLPKVNALPFRAYQLIYNEYYRDQNLTDEISISKSSGDTSITIHSANNNSSQIWRLRKRAWRKDYFTSALPFAQRGPDATIPLVSQDANVITSDDRSPVRVGNLISGTNDYGLDVDDGTAATGQDLLVNSHDFTGSTINDLRRAFSLQKFLENNARGGARYVEQILSHFGVVSPDARLQRPEFLGGSRTPIVISEVLQNSQTTESSALGTMGGHGVSASTTPRIRRKFTEHGLVMGIMSVTPTPAYMQGLPKLFQKFDKFDYYYPEFAHLGEQEIKNSEIYLGVNEDDDKTFGYTPRYSEYKFKPSTVHGDMLTDLSFWHMANDYAERPNLNTEFVECDPTHRVFAVEDKQYQKLIIQTHCDFQAIRPMPKHSIPSL